MSEKTELGPNERLIDVGEVRLAVETFGRPEDPAILLVMGAAASMLHWDDQLCEKLADGARHVIRYDNRDTGRSTSWPVGRPTYALRDLVADALGVLDTLGVRRAHVVGMSMGAAIGQLLAIEHAERVRTLTLLSGTPGGPGREVTDLPPMSPELAALFAGDDDERPDDAAVAAADPVDALVDGERAFAGTLPFDEPRWRDVAERSLLRTSDISTADNHFLLDPGAPWRPRLGGIDVPTLVVHGTADPLFPVEHGEALAREIPRASLLRLDGVGHEAPPRAVYPMLVERLLAHTA